MTEQNRQNILDFADDLLARSTPQIPAWNIEHVLEKKQVKWNYVDGCMIKAVMDLYYATNDKKYLDFAINFIDYFVEEDGNIKGYDVDELNCDNINMGKMLFDLYRITGNQKYRKAIELQYSQILKQPRTKSGNFWHKLIYPNQIWLDGLYMVQPFCAEYEILSGKNDSFEGLKQFKNVREFMRDKSSGLYYHGYDESREIFWANKETGLSPNFWLRSLGWYSMALVDTADKLGEKYSAEVKWLSDELKELIDALLKVIDTESKMFYQVPDKGNLPGNYLETSGSCAIAYVMMKGTRLGMLPPDYFEKGNEIFNGVMLQKLVIDSGTFVLKDVCLVAGLGGMPGKGEYKLRDGSFEYYISEPRVNNDAKGVAPFLFCFTELQRREQSQ